MPKHLVLPHCHDLKPRYFIYAGLVFTRLTNFYLRHQYGADWSTKVGVPTVLNALRTFSSRIWVGFVGRVLVRPQ